MNEPKITELELSTQHLIAAAQKRAIRVEVLDYKDNMIRLTKGDRVEIVMQATRTSADNYIAPLIMTNKHVTKVLLHEKGIQVPAGYRVSRIEEGLALYQQIQSQAMVVKPLSTNFGLGITMLDKDFSFEAYSKALEVAFGEDDDVLIESFAKGKEYRFLVIGDRVVAILHRVPANVEGDGFHSIEALVAKKNEDPLRGTKYKKPLEKIKLGDFECTYLQEQGLTRASILKKGQVVYLRKNSNISTGGDSLDFTELIHSTYGEIALKASQSVGAKVCGVDMVIEEIDSYDPNGYSIIELNFNPAIHIHNAPYKGKNRHADDAILDLLDFH